MRAEKLFISKSDACSSKWQYEILGGLSAPFPTRSLLLQGRVLFTHLTGSHPEHRISEGAGLNRPRVNARLMPEAEARRRFKNISAGLTPSCPSLTDSVKGGRGLCSSLTSPSLDLNLN